MSTHTLAKSEIILHWLVGLGMIALIGVGLYMSRNEVYSLYPIHKSVGVILFVVIALRAVIRLRKGWPSPTSTGKPWEHKLARVMHWVLIIGTLAMPLSGMMDAVMAGRGLSVFGAELVASNMGASGQPVAINAALSDAASAVHGLFGKVLIAVILLHVVGALKHHVVDRDVTLRRMLGRA